MRRLRWRERGIASKRRGTPLTKGRVSENKSRRRATQLFKDSAAGPGWTPLLSSEAYLPRIHQVKPICPGFSTTDWIKLRRWQRMMDHARWITDFILEAHERTFFVTVTFFRFVSDRQAKEAGRRFFQKRLAPVIEGYVRVIERQRNGRPHVHWIFRLITSACTDDWKIIKLAIQRYGRMFGFGRFDCDPVEHPKKLAWYLVKSFKEGALHATGKVVTYSNNLRRVKYATDSRRWEHAVSRFAEKLGCATKQELTKKLGIGWPFRYRRQIYAGGAFEKSNSAS